MSQLSPKIFQSSSMTQHGHPLKTSSTQATLAIAQGRIRLSHPNRDISYPSSILQHIHLGSTSVVLFKATDGLTNRG
jgi:hypothetical protein